jgi:DNA-binding response OmpR family regulator
MDSVSSNEFKILIVDDSQALRILLKEMITRNRITSLIYEAENGKKGLQMFVRVKPDLIIMDLMMPELNGIEAIKIIHKHDPSVRILVLTTSHNTEDTREAISYGASDVVYKPFRENDLVRRITNQLREKLVTEHKVIKNSKEVSAKTSKLDHRLKVLICEDEEPIGKMYKKAVDVVGHRSVLTHTGERCIIEFKHALTEWPFDVVVLDYKLPDKTGEDVAKEILAENPDQRIIFVSGYGNSVLEKIGKLNNKIDFLTKPISLVTLIEKIEEGEIKKRLSIHQ